MARSGARLLAARASAPHAATLRELYGALAPVAVVPPEGDVLVCPGRDTVVREGDEVTLIGTPRELADAAVIDHPERIRRLTATAAASPPAHGGASYGVLGVLAPQVHDETLAGGSAAGRALRELRDLVMSFVQATDRRIA